MFTDGSNFVYLDNAATSWPKSPSVASAMHEYMTHCGIGIGRSSGRQAEFIRGIVESLRRNLAVMLNASADEIILTNSATDGLNLVIQGLLLNQFDAMTCLAKNESPQTTLPLIVTTQIEHNSVLRPLHAWEQKGRLRVATLPCDAMGQVIWDDLEQLLLQQPKMLCVSHASNVTGVIQDLDLLSERCRSAGTMLLIDAAQTLGCLDIDVQKIGCDFLVASGHKGLGGPLGTGVAFIRRDQQGRIDSLRLGGTGSLTSKLAEELVGPIKWEAGNANVPGLIGLAAAIDERTGKSRRDSRLSVAELASKLWLGLGNLEGVTRIADPGIDPFEQSEARLPIVNILAEGWDPASLAIALESAAGVVTRAGYHCAPLIHSALGTSESGTLRCSLGPYNTARDVELLLETLEKVCRF